ncbi:Hsp33 family molecular chaperone HslO [Pusillimonas caeni]|uniref:Hsp33 family molecular chaperone HslO n=1 Tax=Pusillimonas caeni TaxID=1348472 RepID=UPI000E59CBFD|nr:Hsp33 family molecular chaperone HslO [Pusillimonas caeni]TFL13746.1 Hsp33 family molecular chaperone HslO [Pusillimonas caeni]
MTDLLKKYLFQDHSVRVQAVKLDEAWRTGLAHQSYPPCVQRLLGELTAAAVLLAANIKFDGSLVLQLQGDGPVALIVVECTSDLTIRATASLREGLSVPRDGNFQSLLNSQGQGRFIVVLDPQRKNAAMQPYQGIVPLEGDSVAQVLEHYMRNSEQLDTRLWLAADAGQTAGLLLQRMPDQGGTEAPGPAHDTWERAVALASTIESGELLGLDTDTLIHRLFWEETLIAFEPQNVSWHCPCTRERVANMLRMLGQEEVEDILSQRDQIDVSCNFCGKPYRFDPIDCARLFTSPQDTPPSGAGSIH